VIYNQIVTWTAFAILAMFFYEFCFTFIRLVRKTNIKQRKYIHKEVWKGSNAYSKGSINRSDLLPILSIPCNEFSI